MITVMRTAKEFYARLKKDEAFYREINRAAEEELASGTDNYRVLLNSIAADRGYWIPMDEIAVY